MITERCGNEIDVRSPAPAGKTRRARIGCGRSATLEGANWVVLVVLGIPGLSYPDLIFSHTADFCWVHTLQLGGLGRATARHLGGGWAAGGADRTLPQPHRTGVAAQ